MNVIGYEIIQKFARQHANARPSLEKWYQVALNAQWRNFDDVRQTFNSADIYL
ncbi:MAG: type II toxin-antitoxin system HigB family toxin [Blastocatellia bacterium]